MVINQLWKSFGCFFAACVLLTGPGALADKVSYVNNENVKAFAKDFAKKYNKSYEATLAILEKGVYKQSIIDAMTRPAEFTMEWKDYSKIFLKRKRIEHGITFWKKHRKELAEVSAKYGVEEEVILAIIGVETWYGTRMGNYRVLDALMTLGMSYPPRAKFFSKELEEFLLLTEEQKLDPTKLLGSYAGAMGYGQFIPSSYRAYAVNYDSGPIDIWNDPGDAIASVANYLHKHKWQYGDLIALKVMNTEVDSALVTKGITPDKTVKALRQKQLIIGGSIKDEVKVTLMELTGNAGKEYWLGFPNFYVITRYNRSTLYAMAVFELSQLLKLEMDVIK